jgi:hypothetical protein
LEYHLRPVEGRTGILKQKVSGENAVFQYLTTTGDTEVKANDVDELIRTRIGRQLARVDEGKMAPILKELSEKAERAMILYLDGLTGIRPNDLASQKAFILSKLGMDIRSFITDKITKKLMTLSPNEELWRLKKIYVQVVGNLALYEFTARFLQATSVRGGFIGGGDNFGDLIMNAFLIGGSHSLDVLGFIFNVAIAIGSAPFSISHRRPRKGSRRRGSRRRGSRRKSSRRKSRRRSRKRSKSRRRTRRKSR